MKKYCQLLAIAMFYSVVGVASAQTTLKTWDFETAGNRAEWSLNVAENGGGTQECTMWLFTNRYNGGDVFFQNQAGTSSFGGTIPGLPSQPGGLQTFYLSHSYYWSSQKCLDDGGVASAAGSADGDCNSVVVEMPVSFWGSVSSTNADFGCTNTPNGQDIVKFARSNVPVAIPVGTTRMSIIYDLISGACPCSQNGGPNTSTIFISFNGTTWQAPTLAGSASCVSGGCLNDSEGSGSAPTGWNRNEQYIDVTGQSQIFIGFLHRSNVSHAGTGCVDPGAPGVDNVRVIAHDQNLEDITLTDVFPDPVCSGNITGTFTGDFENCNYVLEILDGPGGTVVGNGSLVSAPATSATSSIGSLAAGAYFARVRHDPSNVISNEIEFNIIAGASLSCSTSPSGTAGVGQTITWTVADPGVGTGFSVTLTGSDGLNQTQTVNSWPATFTHSFGSTGTKNYTISIAGTPCPVSDCTGSINVATLKTLSMTGLTPSTVCTDALPTTVDVAFSGTEFAGTENLEVQLSDASGSFTSPTATASTTASNSIGGSVPQNVNLTVPGSLSAGSYEVRVVETGGGSTVSDNTVTLTVGPSISCPTFPTNAQQGTPATLPAAPGTVVSWDFNTGGLANNTGLSGTGAYPGTITFSDPDANPANTHNFDYSVVFDDGAGCQLTCTGTITVGNTAINEPQLSGGSDYCEDQTADITFTTIGTFNSGNQFNMEVRDNTGAVVFTQNNVTSPISLDLASNGITPGPSGSSAYNVVINSTDPVLSSPLSIAFNVIANPTGTITLTDVDNNPATSFRLKDGFAVVNVTGSSTVGNNCSWTITYEGGSTITCNTCDFSGCILPPYATAGNYTATLNITEPINNCPGTVVVPFTIMPEAQAVALPNIFTPNNDGINDFFFVDPTQFKKLDIKIFSRNGQLVYSATDGGFKPWDGKFNGQDSPEGVYVVILKATDLSGNAIEKSGSLTIIR